MTLPVDPLVVAAASLEQGVAWCEAKLGVTPGPAAVSATVATPLGEVTQEFP